MPHGNPININGVTWFFWAATNPLATQYDTLVDTPVGFTIGSIRHHLPSPTGLADMDYDLRFGSSVSVGGGTKIITAGLNSDNTPAVETVFDNAVIPADNYVWVEASALANGPASNLLIRIVLA